MRPPALVALGAAALLWLAMPAGCGQTTGGGQTGPVRVAVITASQGALAKQGEMLKLGAQLKAEEVNAAGGVGGARVELVFFEGGCDPRQAQAAARRAVADPRVAFVLGPLCSGAAHAVEDVLDAAGLAAILPTASAEYLVHARPVLFRMVPSDARQAALLAIYASREMGIRRVGIVCEPGVFGQVVGDGFEQEARRAGLVVVGRRPCGQDSASVERALRELAAKEPEALFLAGDAVMGAAIARAADRLGLAVELLGTSLMADRDLLALGGKAVEGLTLAEPLVVEPREAEARDFIDRFQQRFNQRASWIAASAYDGLGVGLQALSQARGTRTGVRGRLSAMNLAACGYDGATGLSFFDRDGGNLRPVRLVRVESGAFVEAVEQFKPVRRAAP